MGKKFSLLRGIMYLVALGIFGWCEYQLGLKYLEENKVRKEIITKNTKKIEEAFLLREEKFYLDKKYKKDLEELRKINIEDLSGGGDSCGYTEELQWKD